MERKCDDCGLPISICNAITAVRLAVTRNGQEAVKAALANAGFPPPPRSLTMWHRIDDPDNPPPKDGTLILLWATHWGSQINGNHRLDVGRVAIGSRAEEDAEFRMDDELEWREDGGTYYCAWVTASHWMPLPPPPAEDTP